MRKQTLIRAFLAASLVQAAAQAAAPPVLETTARERRDVMVTIYNDNRGLIREVRSVSLPQGRFDLKYADVADKIVPQSVHIVSRTDAKAVDVIEQNYKFDVLTPARLMERAVGTELTFVRENPATGAESRVRALLLAHEQGNVFKVGNEIVIGNLGRPVFASLPPAFVSRPTLVWSLENRAGPRAHELEVAYLTGGMTWHADYVTVLSGDDKQCSINGWVTLNNESGAAFDAARLALVAGTVHRATEELADATAEVTKAPAPGARDKTGFSEESLLDYHLYTLGRVTDLKDKEQKQVALLAATAVPVTKVLRLVASPSLAGSPDPLQENIHPKVLLEFVNTPASRLGMPLPMGTVRVYKADQSGGQQFIGEDSIQHTPSGEKVSLELGESFDVVAERRSVEFKTLSRLLTESVYEVKVKNHKDEAATVQVEEHLSGEWEILEATPTKGEKLDARRQRFTLQVPAKGEVVLRYKVRARFG